MRMSLGAALVQYQRYRWCGTSVWVVFFSCRLTPLVLPLLSPEELTRTAVLYLTREGPAIIARAARRGYSVDLIFYRCLLVKE